MCIIWKMAWRNHCRCASQARSYTRIRSVLDKKSEFYKQHNTYCPAKGGFKRTLSVYGPVALFIERSIPLAYTWLLPTMTVWFHTQFTSRSSRETVTVLSPRIGAQISPLPYTSDVSPPDASLITKVCNQKNHAAWPGMY